MIMAKTLNYLLLAVRGLGQSHIAHKTQKNQNDSRHSEKIESDGISLAESFELEIINSLQVESTGGQISC